MLLKEIVEEPEISVDDVMEIIDIDEQNKWMPEQTAEQFFNELRSRLSNGN